MWRATVLKDDRLLQRSSRALGVADWRLLGSLMMQRPYETADIGFGSSLTDLDLELIQRTTRANMEAAVRVLKGLPRVLALLLRNINLTRSLNQVRHRTNSAFCSMVNAYSGYLDQHRRWGILLIVLPSWAARLYEGCIIGTAKGTRPASTGRKCQNLKIR